MIIINIDASALSRSSCMLRFWNTVIHGYRSKLNANDIEYGTAFHKFAAHLAHTKGLNRFEAFKIATDYFKTKPMIVKPKKDHLNVSHLANTMLGYCDKFLDPNDGGFICDYDILRKPGEEDTKAMAEMKFSYQIYEDDVFVINLCGTVDLLVKIHNGCYAIADYKTTSVWSDKEYFAGYRLSPQIIFYTYILQQYAIKYPDSIFERIVKTGFGAFIEGLFLHPTNATRFLRSEVFFFKTEQIQEFVEMLNAKIEMIKKYARLNLQPLREGMLNGACHTQYGMCSFANVCALPDEVSRQHVLKNTFIQKHYNPLTFDKD